MLEILEVVAKKLELKEKVEEAHLDKIIEFIKVFADKCHHGKEEEILFPAMEAAGLPKEEGPVAVMLMEHDMGRGFVRAMSQARDDYKNGQAEAMFQVIENGRNYIGLLREHIDKEDSILYPIAEMHIPEERQNELVEEFEKIEEERIGQGKHEEFHRLLEDLKKIYLCFT